MQRSPTQFKSLSLENIPQAELESLEIQAKLYAWANSVLFKQPSPIESYSQVPFCLFPSPFPRDQFEKAVRLQTSYNQLYLNIASSPALIKEVLGPSISKVDPFVGRLFELWEKVEGQAPKDKARWALGIFRNDYLLHQPTPSSPPEIKQVEFNTVSVSFGSLASKTSDLHRFLAGLTPVFPPSQLPPNPALQSIAKALRMAHQHYLRSERPSTPAVILMVVKPDETNVFDQALIEYELALDAEPIRMVRVAYDQILRSTSLDPTTQKLTYSAGHAAAEVSVAYYRSMYGPEDFRSEESWEARGRLESSRAINCPDAAIQLAGCKKFQQVLTERAFRDAHQALLTAGMAAAAWDELQSTWTAMYPLEGAEGLRVASDPAQAADYVLKPQREGGGHNVYGASIPAFVRALSAEERQAYILMRLIQPPRLISNLLVRPTPDPARLNPSLVVSELGIFGFGLLLKSPPDPCQSSPLHTPHNLLFNFHAGHLLRTKHADSHEGGIAVGSSCLDSPLLV